MARVLVATQAWGIFWQSDGPANTGGGLQVKLPSGQQASINTTVYADSTGNTQVPLPWTADDNGVLPGWVEEGNWILTINTVPFAVEAVSGTVGGRVAGIENGSAWSGASVGDVLTYGTPLTWMPPSGAAPSEVVWAQKYLDQVPGTYTNATAAIEAAMAATGTYGGRVILPGILIDMVGELTFPNKDIDLVGASRGGTILRWLTDSGINTYAVRRVDGKRQVIRHMSCLGPVDAFVDAPYANMWGLLHLGRNGLEDVHIQGFRAGIVRAGDHSWMRAVSSKANRDGIYCMGDADAGVTTGGNNQILAPMELDANARAGIAFAPLAYTFGEKWEGIHFGLCPTPVHWEVDGSNNAAAVTGMQLDSCVFENRGNANFYSASTTQAGTFSGTLTNCSGSQYPGSTDLPPTGFRSAALRNNRAHFDGLASVNITCIDTDVFGFESGPIPANFQYGGYQAASFDEGDVNALTSAISTGAKWLANPLAYQLVHTIFRERQYYREAEVHYCDNAGITAGRLVYRSADGGVRPWVAGREVYGVALQTGAAFDFIPIGRKGIWPIANSATGALAVGDPVIPDSATADGKIKIAGAAPGAIIGTVMIGGAAGTTVHVDLTPTGWRF